MFYSLPDEEVPVFPDLLRRMLKYGPRSRATVQEILEHPWFVDSCFDGIVVPVTAKHTLAVLVITLLLIALLVCTLVGLSGSGLNRNEPCCCHALVINVYGRTGTPPFTHDIDEGDSGQTSKNFKYSQKSLFIDLHIFLSSWRRDVMGLHQAPAAFKTCSEE